LDPDYELIPEEFRILKIFPDFFLISFSSEFFNYSRIGIRIAIG
jgi:hypothetical protein